MLKIPFINLIKTYVQQHKQTIFGPRWFSLAEVINRLEPLIGWDQEALKASRVAVVGCGALGGNFALAIARYGVGEILLFDYDEVDRFYVEKFRIDRYDYEKALKKQKH